MITKEAVMASFFVDKNHTDDLLYVKCPFSPCWEWATI